MAEKTKKVPTVTQMATRIARQLEGRSRDEQRRTLDAVAAMLGIEERTPEEAK